MTSIESILLFRVEHIVDNADAKQGLVEAEGGNATYDPAITERLVKIQKYISDGAKAFLKAEYEILGIFIVIFGLIVVLLLGLPKNCGEALPASC